MELPNHTGWLPPRFFPNPQKVLHHDETLLRYCLAAAEINNELEYMQYL